MQTEWNTVLHLDHCSTTSESLLNLFSVKGWWNGLIAPGLWGHAAQNTHLRDILSSHGKKISPDSHWLYTKALSGTHCPKSPVQNHIDRCTSHKQISRPFEIPFLLRNAKASHGNIPSRNHPSLWCSFHLPDSWECLCNTDKHGKVTQALMWIL